MTAARQGKRNSNFSRRGSQEGTPISLHNRRTQCDSWNSNRSDKPECQANKTSMGNEGSRSGTPAREHGGGGGMWTPIITRRRRGSTASSASHLAPSRARQPGSPSPSPMATPGSVRSEKVGFFRKFRRNKDRSRSDSLASINSISSDASSLAHTGPGGSNIHSPGPLSHAHSHGNQSDDSLSHGSQSSIATNNSFVVIGDNGLPGTLQSPPGTRSLHHSPGALCTDKDNTQGYMDVTSTSHPHSHHNTMLQTISEKPSPPVNPLHSPGTHNAHHMQVQSDDRSLHITTNTHTLPKDKHAFPHQPSDNDIMTASNLTLTESSEYLTASESDLLSRNNTRDQTLLRSDNPSGTKHGLPMMSGGELESSQTLPHPSNHVLPAKQAISDNTKSNTLTAKNNQAKTSYRFFGKKDKKDKKEKKDKKTKGKSVTAMLGSGLFAANLSVTASKPSAKFVPSAKPSQDNKSESSAAQNSGPVGASDPVQACSPVENDDPYIEYDYDAGYEDFRPVSFYELDTVQPPVLQYTADTSPPVHVSDPHISISSAAPQVTQQVDMISIPGGPLPIIGTYTPPRPGSVPPTIPQRDGLVGRELSTPPMTRSFADVVSSPAPVKRVVQPPRGPFGIMHRRDSASSINSDYTNEDINPGLHGRLPGSARSRSGGPRPTLKPLGIQPIEPLVRPQIVTGASSSPHIGSPGHYNTGRPRTFAAVVGSPSPSGVRTVPGGKAASPVATPDGPGPASCHTLPRSSLSPSGSAPALGVCGARLRAAKAHSVQQLNASHKSPPLSPTQPQSPVFNQEKSFTQAKSMPHLGEMKINIERDDVEVKVTVKVKSEENMKSKSKEKQTDRHKRKSGHKSAGDLSQSKSNDVTKKIPSDKNNSDPKAMDNRNTSVKYGSASQSGASLIISEGNDSMKAGAGVLEEGKLQELQGKTTEAGSSEGCPGGGEETLISQNDTASLSCSDIHNNIPTATKTNPNNPSVPEAVSEAVHIPGNIPSVTSKPVQKEGKPAKSEAVQPGSKTAEKICDNAQPVHDPDNNPVIPSGVTNVHASVTPQVKPPSRRKRSQKKREQKSVKLDDKLSTHVSQNSKPGAKPSQGVNKVPVSAPLKTETTMNSPNITPQSASPKTVPTGNSSNNTPQSASPKTVSTGNNSSNSTPQSAPHYIETKQTVINPVSTSHTSIKTAQSQHSVQSSDNVTLACIYSVSSEPVQNVASNAELSIQKTLSDGETCGEGRKDLINSVVNTKSGSVYIGQFDKNCRDVGNSVLTETEVKSGTDPEKVQQNEKSLSKEVVPKQDVISGVISGISKEAPPQVNIHSQIVGAGKTSGEVGSGNKGIQPQATPENPSQSSGTYGKGSSIKPEPNIINREDHLLKPRHSDENQIEKNSDCVTGDVKLESSSISVPCEEKVQAPQLTGNLHDVVIQKNNQADLKPAENLHSLVQVGYDNGSPSESVISNPQLKGNLSDFDSDKSHIMGSGESKGASRDGRRKSKSPDPGNNNFKTNSLGRKGKSNSGKNSSVETIGIKCDANDNRNRIVRHSGNLSQVEGTELQVRNSITSDVQQNAVSSPSRLTHNTQVGDNELSNLEASGISQELNTGVSGAAYNGKSPSPAGRETGHYAAAGTAVGGLAAGGAGLTAGREGVAGFTTGQAAMNSRITRSSERHVSPPPRAPPRAHRTLSSGCKRRPAPEDAVIAYHPLDATAGGYHTLPRSTRLPTTVKYRQDIQPGKQYGATTQQLKYPELSQTKHMDQSTSGSAVQQDMLSSRDCRKEGAHTPDTASQSHTGPVLSPSVQCTSSTNSTSGPGGSEGNKQEDPLLLSVNLDSGSLQGAGVTNKSRTVSTPLKAMQTTGKQVTQASTGSVVNSNQKQQARLEITSETISTSPISSNNEQLAKLSSAIPCQNQQKNSEEVSTVGLDSNITSQLQVHIHSDTPGDIKTDSKRITQVTVENILPEHRDKLQCDKQTGAVYKHAVNIAGTKDLASNKDINTDLGSPPSSLDSFHTASPPSSFQSGLSVSPQGQEGPSGTSRFPDTPCGQGPVILDGQIAVKDVGECDSKSKPMIFEELMSLKDVEVSSEANSSALSSLESDQGKAGEVHIKGNLPATETPTVTQPDHLDHPGDVPVSDQPRMTGPDSLVTNNTENSNYTSEMGTDYSKPAGDEGDNSSHALNDSGIYKEHDSKVRPTSDEHKQSESISVSADLLHTAQQSDSLSSPDSNSAQSNQQILNISSHSKLKQDNTVQHKDNTSVNQDSTSVNQGHTSLHQDSTSGKDNTSGQDLSSNSASAVNYKEGILNRAGNISAGNNPGVNSSSIQEDIVRAVECVPAESSINPGAMSTFHKYSINSPSCTDHGGTSSIVTSSDSHGVGDNRRIIGNTQTGGKKSVNQTRTGSRQGDGQAQVPVPIATEPEVVPILRGVGAAASDLQKGHKAINRSAQKRHSWGPEVRYLGQKFITGDQGQQKAMWHPPPTVNIRGSLPSLSTIGRRRSSDGLTYKQAVSQGCTCAGSSFFNEGPGSCIC